MKRLIKLEILKNLSYRPFKIFSILYLCAIIILAFIGFAEFNFFFFKFKLKDVGIYNFPNVWHFTAYILSVLKVFLAAIIVYSISQEFSNRMFKQNIIDGLSKWEFLKSKILTIALFSAMSSLLVLILGLLFGLKYSVAFTTQDALSELYFVGLYFIKVFLFLNLFLFLTILFRNAIFPFLSIFIWWILEGVLSATKWLGMIYEFLPLHTLSKIVAEPFSRIKMNIIDPESGNLYSISQDVSFPVNYFIIGLAYIALFILASYKILDRRDW